MVGGEGSEVNVWDIDTGEMVVQFSDCHGNNEITAMTIDASGRRLITGSRKGDIKVSNHNVTIVTTIKLYHLMLVPLCNNFH